MGNLIDLGKKAKVVLEKKNLNTVKADIQVAVDISGSMRSMFSSGTVQEIIDRLLGIGVNMDVDDSIDVFAFNTGAKFIGTANRSNHKDFINDVFLRQTSVSGGTKYAPVMEEIIRRSQNDVKEIKQKGLLKKMFGKKSFEIVPKEYPTFVFFITDGDNFDRQQTNEVITEAARQGIFWQFVGIGNPTDGFTYLEHLDELEGRYIDNANFFSVNDILSISDSELYDRLLNEFPTWLKEAKVKGLIL